MSLQSWKDEFYPVDASECGKSHREQLEHSLRKWRGATKENAAKHGCFYKDHFVISKAESECSGYPKAMGFGTKSCALCKNNRCRDCPIFLSGRHSCISIVSEYAASDNDPSSIIAVLEELLEQY